MRILPFVASSMILAAQPSFAQTVDAAISSHPNPSVVSFYQSNTEQITELYAVVTDGSQIQDARLSAFAQLALEYPIAAKVAARELVGDEATAVALQAVQYLMGDVVMSDHDMSNGVEGFSPLVRYTMISHMTSRAALRAAITDERVQLRDTVAPFLASLSDSAALEAITTSPELYTDAEAASLVTLSSSEESLALLENYISSDDTSAQATSVEYLAAFPNYQSRIRSEVLLNGEMDDVVRTAAAESLSLYDSDFASYALIVAGEQGVSPELYQRVVSGYVEQVINDGRLGPEAAGNFANQIGNFIDSIEDKSQFENAIGEIEAIEQRLQSISDF